MIPTTHLTPDYAIPRIINGGWQLSEGHTKRHLDPHETLQSLFQIAEAGFTAFDCADIYTGVEEMFGAFLKQWRQHHDIPIRIHTKYVPNLDDLANLKPHQIAATIDRSIQRLGVECLDLVQFHWWDYEVPGYVEAALELQKIQKAGKIRLIGGTNFDVPRLKELVEAGVKPVSMQIQYSLLDRRAQNGMAQYCQEQGIKLLCYGSLAGGFLSSRYHQRQPAPEPENRSLTKYGLIIKDFGGWGLFQDLLEVMTEIAKETGVDLANIAVAWLLGRPAVGAAIVGARHAGHIASNLRVFQVALTEEHLQKLEEVLARSTGPEGDTFALEREPGGPHSVIMKTNLN